MKENLSKPVTISKLAEALQALPKQSCPGEDGLPSDFYISKWDMLKEHLRDAFQEVLDS